MPHPGYENDEFWNLATNIPDDFKIALAELIINFGRLEFAVDQLIWWAAGIDNAQVGKALTARLDIRPKCEMALTVLQELVDDTAFRKFKAINRDIETASKRRNAVTHGWWTAYGEFAVAMSARGKSDPAALIGGEPFTIMDLLNDAALTKEAERAILELINGLAPSPKKRTC